MKRKRVSMAALMGAVATVAVDFSIIRSFDANSAEFSLFFLFVTGAMPLVSLLILIGSIEAPKILRDGEVSSFVVGFEAIGWAVVFAFITCYSIATRTVMGNAEAIAAVCRPSVIAYLQGAPDWAGILVEFGFATILFSLPQLLIAILGGCLTRRLGLTARFSLTSSASQRAASPHDCPSPLLRSEVHLASRAGD